MATGTFFWYNNAIAKALNKEIDWNSDTLKIQLHTSSYTPDRNADAYQSDLSNEVANGNGYTTGGATLTTPTVTVVPAASATAWASTTAYVVGDVVRKVASNGYVYRCVVAGTSGGTEPTWPTVIGQTVTDGTVTWVCAGVGYVRLDADDPSWASSTITARYAVIVDTTPGSAATNPLIGYLDFGSDVSSSSATFSITFNAAGILHFFS